MSFSPEAYRMERMRFWFAVCVGVGLLGFLLAVAGSGFVEFAGCVLVVFATIIGTVLLLKILDQLDMQAKKRRDTFNPVF